MTYDLEAFCRDCRDAIDPETHAADLETIRSKLEQLLHNEEFVNAHCGPGAAPGTHELYHDPDTDFMVLAHVNETEKRSPPHDHGASWAVYGQAVAFTEMTEYERKDDGSDDGHAELSVARTYRLDPGMAGTFGPHEIHSIHFPDGARFIRVTGTDLTKLETLRYDMGSNSVTVVAPNDQGDVAGAASV